MDLYLTLDYELYNGLKSGTVQNCLITPTEELLKVLDKYAVKAVFFVDVCFMLRLREVMRQYPELVRDYESIVNQLKKLSDEGHSIQLHVHPNWKRASYQDGYWTSVMEDYKISDLKREEVDRIFHDGIEMLRGITGKEVTAFRAGAYCIQTYDGYDKLFARHGIKIDSSVNRNKKAKTEKWEWFDFTQIPEEYSYFFSDNVCIKDENGQFLEYSIPNYRFSKMDVYKRNWALSNEGVACKPWGDGKASVGGALYKGLKKYWVKIKNRLTHIYVSASIDGSNTYFLERVFHREKKHGGYMMIMGHPKCLSQYSLRELSTFLNNHLTYLNNKVF